MGPLRVCTIIAKNYWASARVLARSIHDHHADARVTVLVLDADDALKAEAATTERFDVLAPDDIGLEPGELRRMAAIYDVLELSTALKPWLLQTLLRRDDAPVIYLDPDIEVFAPLDEIDRLAAEHGIVLTPHTIKPFALDDYRPSEITLLQSGVFNLGFIAVGPTSTPFLEWWSGRLKRDCLESKPEGLFVDQRWVDLAPLYFEAYVLRDPGYNVAYWNLTSRTLDRDGDRYVVDGVPLRFFHYSGYDPEKPNKLSKYQNEPERVRLDERPVLAELCARYGDEMLRLGHRAWKRIPLPYTRTAAGTLLDARARRVYREALLEHEQRNDPFEPPNPFGETGAYEAWMTEVVGRGEVNRYLRAFYDERPDVAAAFPDVDDADALLFGDWVRSSAVFTEGLIPELIPRAPRASQPDGVDLVGYVAAENGVGEAARLYADAMRSAGIEVQVFANRETASRQELAVGESSDTRHDVNVFCINADQLARYLSGDGGRLFPLGPHRVAVWAWEVEKMTREMGSAGDHVDEIWTYSEHAAHAIRTAADRDVYVIPPPIVRPDVTPMSRAQLGLPDGFLFLFCFDFDSVFERKNPIAVIEAFTKAFPSPTDAQLVIKSVRGDAHPEKLATLHAAASGRDDISVIDGYRNAAEQHALMDACDAYVSLHRSEGFGLTMAEAMALGKPTVATNYSGNLEFMDATNSWLIDFAFVPVGEGCDPYPSDARWADADLDHAARVLREIVDDPAAAKERGARAAADIARLHAPSVTGAAVRFRLEQMWRTKLTSDERALSRPWTPVEAAEHLLSSPGMDEPAGSFARRVANRALRRFSDFQDRRHAATLEALRDLQGRLEAEQNAVRELEARVRELEGKRPPEAR